MASKYMEGYSDLSKGGKRLFLESLSNIRRASYGSDALLKETLSRCEGYTPAEGDLMSPSEWKETLRKSVGGLYGKHLLKRIKKL